MLHGCGKIVVVDKAHKKSHLRFVMISRSMKRAELIISLEENKQKAVSGRVTCKWIIVLTWGATSRIASSLSSNKFQIHALNSVLQVLWPLLQRGTGSSKSTAGLTVLEVEQGSGGRSTPLLSQR